jgi:ribonuclease HI
LELHTGHTSQTIEEHNPLQRAAQSVKCYKELFSRRLNVSGAGIVYGEFKQTPMKWIHKSIPLPETHTSNEAEFIAVIHGLEVAYKTMHPLSALGTSRAIEQRIEIEMFSDSQESLGSLKLFDISKGIPHSHDNYEASKKVRSFLLWLLKDLGVTVRFSWVPGHAKILGNEYADEMAGIASDTIISVGGRKEAIPPFMIWI